MEINLALDSFKYDNKKCSFELIMKCARFPSVNSMYKINTFKNTVTKDEATIKFENELKNQIAYCDPVAHCPWITRETIYGWKMNFLIKYSFWKRDLSNMIKSPEDVIFKALGVNDARVVEASLYKSYISKDSVERLIVRVFKSNFDYNYFNN